MKKRSFRNPESYEAERVTRDMIQDFLLSKGFSDIIDNRKTIGKTQSQNLIATAPDGARINMRVRLGWYQTGKSRHNYSAAQLRARVIDHDWEGTLNALVKKLVHDGMTHLLVVQRKNTIITHAALIPLEELVSIWCDQRDVSKSLIDQGKLGRRKKNHAMNGSSPTIWLEDDAAPEVADVLWKHKNVQDLVKLKNDQKFDSSSFSDDTFDDLPGYDSSLIGSDNPQVSNTNKSYVKRDRRVRIEVIKRAQGKCERKECGEKRNYPGFLDVHHILGAEKSDRVFNCVALCPNCHREAHASPDRGLINKSLLEIASLSNPSIEHVIQE